jgi:hypothetical protein
MADKVHQIPFPTLGDHLSHYLPTNDYLSVLPASTSSSLKFLAAQQLILIFALGYTKRDSILRFGLFLPMALSSILGLAIYSQYPVRSSAILMIVVPLGAASQVLQYISLVLIRRWSYEDRVALFTSSSSLTRLQFGLYSAYSFRHCGTPYEVGGCPQFKDKRTPTKTQFLFRTGAIVAANFLVMDFVSYLSGTDENPAFAQARVPFFSRLDEVTIAEVFERMVIVTLLYASNIALLTIGIGVVSMISVGTGLSDPSRWKPTFNYDHGFPYSVRRFWSHFWHVSMKDRIYLPSKFIADDILGLPKGSLLRRYALIWLTFMASGLFHVMGETGAGASFAEDGSFFYYTAQAGAIMAEDFVSYLWNRNNGSEKRVTPAWELWVGRVWLALWMTWITPGWFYPMNRLTSGIPVLPISPARAILG